MEDQSVEEDLGVIASPKPRLLIPQEVKHEHSHDDVQDITPNYRSKGIRSTIEKTHFLSFPKVGWIGEIDTRVQNIRT